MAYDINNGKQQVSIFPYQELKSVYGNQVLHGLFRRGIYSGQISLQNKDGDNSVISFIIKSGTTLVFEREDIEGQKFIGKVVLTDDAILNFNKSDLWTNALYNTSGTLYLVADWRYDVATPSEKYVDFTLETDTSIVPIIADEDTTSHKIVIGSILNNLYYVNLPANNSTSLQNYHISYNNQPNRNTFETIFENTDNFQITFDGSGRSIKVGPGKSFISKTMVYNDADTTLTLPTGIQYYISDKVTNTKIDVIATSSEGNYYQIDFLRVILNEASNTNAIQYKWDSVLYPSGTIPFGTNYNSSSTITEAQLLDYVKGKQFPLTDDGITLLIAIRPRNLIPIVDGTSNKMWPECCLLLNGMDLKQFGTVEYNTRMKVPTYTTSDITLTI